MKNTFQLSFEERISKELLKEKGKQCKLGKLKSRQELTWKEQWFVANWIAENLHIRMKKTIMIKRYTLKKKYSIGEISNETQTIILNNYKQVRQTS